MLKTFFGAGVALAAICSPIAADATVYTYDRKGEAATKSVKEAVDKVKTAVDENKKSVDLVEKRLNDINTDTRIPHYEAEIIRLNNMIKSMSYIENVGEEKAFNDNRSALRGIYNETTDIRNAASTARGGSGGDAAPTFSGKLDIPGIGGGGGEASAFGLKHTVKDAKEYLEEFGLVPPDKLYENNEALAQHTYSMLSTLHVAEATVRSVDDSRKVRLDAYEKLAQQAQDAVTTAEALTVNNALMLENGRNLAMLIELQNIGLASEATMLRESAQRNQKIVSAFGVDKGGLIGGLIDIIT